MGYYSKIKRNELLTRQPGAPQNKYGGREEPDRRKRGDAIALFYLYKLRKCRLIWSDQLSAVTMGRSGLGTALGGGARRDARELRGEGRARDLGRGDGSSCVRSHRILPLTHVQFTPCEFCLSEKICKIQTFRRAEKYQKYFF